MMPDADDSPAQRPTQQDFDPFGGDLDANGAWEQFGGVARAAAYEKVCENPLYYQEAFMFMGTVAFDYYFSILERYIREFDLSSSDDVLAILAHCLMQHVNSGRADSALRQRMWTLSD